MKRLLVFLCCCLLMTGCYDYRELNSLAIVTGMGIDLVDEEFQITLEILEPMKGSGEAEMSMAPKLLEGRGKTISDALNNIHKTIPKELFLSNLEILILNKTLLEQEKDFYNFFILNTKEAINPVLVLSENATDIFKTSIEKKESITSLRNTIQNSSQETGETTLLTLMDFFQKTFEPVTELLLPMVQLEEDVLKIQEHFLIKNGKLLSSLTEEDVRSYHLVKGSLRNALLTEQLDEDYFSFHLTKEYASIQTSCKDPSSPIVTIEIFTKVTLSESSLQEEEVLRKTLETSLTKDLQRFLEALKKERIDLLGIGNEYYRYHFSYFDSLKDWYDVYEQLEIKSQVHVRFERTLKEDAHAKN